MIMILTNMKFTVTWNWSTVTSDIMNCFCRVWIVLSSWTLWTAVFFCGVFCISGLDCVGVPWQKPLYLVFLSLNRNDNTEQDVKAGMLSIGSIAVTKFEIVSWETSADLAIVVVTVEFTSISSAFKLCVFSTYPNETVTFRCSAELFPQG